MNSQELDELELFYKLSTPGEWEADEDGTVYNERGDELLTGLLAMECNEVNDAQFAAKLHNAFPALLARVRELEAQVPQWAFYELPKHSNGYDYKASLHYSKAAQLWVLTCGLRYGNVATASDEAARSTGFLFPGFGSLNDKPFQPSDLSEVASMATEYVRSLPVLPSPPKAPTT